MEYRQTIQADFTPHPEHPFFKRWPVGSELTHEDYAHSYHIAHKGALAVSVVCACPHGADEHEDFMGHLVDLLNDPVVRRIAAEKYSLTVFSESEFPAQ